MLDGEPWGRAMWPWEFRSLLEEHLHPRYWSIWIHCDRWGVRQREATGLPTDLATIFVSTFNGPPEDQIVVPQNQIPFRTLVETVPDESGGDLIFKKAHKGWLPALEYLLKEGILAPSPKLSWVMRKDSFGCSPCKYGGHA